MKALENGCSVEYVVARAVGSIECKDVVDASGVGERPVDEHADSPDSAYVGESGEIIGQPAIQVDGELPLLERDERLVVRPAGLVRVRLEDEVRVGGRGVTVLDGSLVIPEEDNDEILEA